MRSFLILPIFFVLAVINQIAAEKGTVISKMECSQNEKLCANLRCKLTRVSQFVTNLTIGCTFPNPVAKILVKMIDFTKIGPNKYRKNLYAHTFDYCQFVDGTENPILKTFSPKLKEILGDLFRPCPFSGDVFGKNMSFDGSTSQYIWGQPLGYRTDITVMTGKYEVILKVVLYGEYISG